MDYNNFTNTIKAASKKIDCDLVIKNINIIDVFNQDIFTSDIAIKNGYIVGLGNYSSSNSIDGHDKFICPSLIDAHAHIESSLVTPSNYSRAAILHGVTTIICDPHEIANVMGIDGIELMIQKSMYLPLDFYFNLPSCVPSTSFECSGATLKASDLEPLYYKEKVLGLAEVMDFPAVLNCDKDMIAKIKTAYDNDKIIDGHGAGFDINSLNAYCTAHIKTDHECHLAEEAINRIRRGMYVLIREGTVAKNLKELLPIINEKTSRRLCFCTDDKHIDDIIKYGSIDSSIRYAIKNNVSAPTAIQIATINAAECYNLKEIGAIAPGYKADFLILSNLNNFEIESVYKNGKLLMHKGKIIENSSYTSKIHDFNNSVKFSDINETSFNIPLDNKKFLNVIELIPNKLESKKLKVKIQGKLNFFHSLINEDLLKVAVIERHKLTGDIGLGIIKGLKLKNGAIATTIAHDSHNLIVCGTNDSDMLFAAKQLQLMGGGIIVVNEGKILAKMQLEIAGLMSERPLEIILEELTKLHKAISILSPDIDFNPFLTLSFLSLPVIPELKITNKGLFDVKNLKFIPIAE